MKAPKTILFRNSAGETWTKPIPPQVRREMHLCVSIDELGAAIDAARTDVDAVTYSDATSPVTLIKEISRLVETIGHLDTTGEAVIAAVKAVLAL